MNLIICAIKYVAELLTQILAFANQYLNEGLFCLWYGAYPFVVLFKPELVEVCASFDELINQLGVQVIISLARKSGLAGLNLSFH